MGGLTILVDRPGLAEILVDAGVDKGIIARHGFLQVRRRHRHSLIFHDYLLREIG